MDQQHLDRPFPAAIAHRAMPAGRAPRNVRLCELRISAGGDAGARAAALDGPQARGDGGCRWAPQSHDAAPFGRGVRLAGRPRFLMADPRREILPAIHVSYPLQSNGPDGPISVSSVFKFKPSQRPLTCVSRLRGPTLRHVSARSG